MLVAGLDDVVEVTTVGGRLERVTANGGGEPPPFGNFRCVDDARGPPLAADDVGFACSIEGFVSRYRLGHLSLVQN